MMPPSENTFGKRYMAGIMQPQGDRPQDRLPILHPPRNPRLVGSRPQSQATGDKKII